jgi:putative hydrolase of the HAD superfamily
MPLAIPGKVIVFDYGEVISIDPAAADKAALVELAGAETESFWGAYWRHRDKIDQATVSVREYWQLIATDLGLSWDTVELHRLWLADFRSWLAIDPDTLDVLIDLQRGGTRMALLSNAGLDFSSYFRNGLLGEFFDQVFTSGELGVLKPDAKIFRALLAGLDVAPSDVVFIDNRRDNIAGAAELGITGHVYTGAISLRSYLEGLAVTTGHDGTVLSYSSDG